MSHIAKKKRVQIEQSLIGALGQVTSDELSYALSVLVKQYVEQSPSPDSPISRCHEVVGALDSAKQIMYEKYVKPYENQAKHDNGDIAE